jgi:DNA replication protein DnaC
MIAAAPPALAGDLVDALRRLKIATVREQAAEVLQTARTQRWEAEEVLRALLQAEIAARDVANRRMRLKQAGFPVLKNLEAFNVPDSSIPRPTYDYIASLEWVQARENLLLVGPVGIAAHYSSFSTSVGKESNFVALEFDTQASTLA